MGQRSHAQNQVPCWRHLVLGMGKASRVRAVPCKAGMVGHQATCCNCPLLQRRTRYRLRTLGPHFGFERRKSLLRI